MNVEQQQLSRLADVMDAWCGGERWIIAAPTLGLQSHNVFSIADVVLFTFFSSWCTNISPHAHPSRVFICCCAQDETWVLRGWWPVHVLYSTVYNSLAIEYIYCIGYCVLSFALRIPNSRAHHEQQKKDLICNAAMFSRGTIRAATMQFNRGLNKLRCSIFSRISCKR